MESKLNKQVDLDEVKALIEENKESAATGVNDQDGTLTSHSSALNIIILLFRPILSLNSSNWLVSVPSWSFTPVAALSLFSSIKALTSSRSTCLFALTYIGIATLVRKKQ
jgi:hypothetical protein